MKRLLLVLLTVTATAVCLQEANADQGLPKVDFQLGQISPLGQGLAIPVKNGGFATSPQTGVSVAVYAKNRQLLMTKFLSVPAIPAGQTRRVIFVPPQGQQISVRATVDPGNRVPETNERNNGTTYRN